MTTRFANHLLLNSFAVGDLLIGHEYQFRVIARNVMGYSEPSDASVPITITASKENDDEGGREEHGVIGLNHWASLRD